MKLQSLSTFIFSIQGLPTSYSQGTKLCREKTENSVVCSLNISLGHLTNLQTPPWPRFLRGGDLSRSPEYRFLQEVVAGCKVKCVLIKIG